MKLLVPCRIHQDPLCPWCDPEESPPPPARASAPASAQVGGSPPQPAPDLDGPDPYAPIADLARKLAAARKLQMGEVKRAAEEAGLDWFAVARDMAHRGHCPTVSFQECA